MKPLQHDNCNVVIGPGENVGVDPLPACRDARNGYWYTYWEPSEEDRRRIAQGGHVRLCVMGMRHPPVMVDTQDWE